MWKACGTCQEINILFHLTEFQKSILIGGEAGAACLRVLRRALPELPLNTVANPPPLELSSSLLDSLHENCDVSYPNTAVAGSG